jgi:hypothetical protein
MAAAFKRSGLHRLECVDCPGYVYATVAMLETHGLPSCPCGGRMVPSELELAALLSVDNGRQDEIERLALDKQMSQERSLGKRRAAIAEARAHGTINDMAAKAYAEYRAAEHEASRGRRLAAIGLGETVEYRKVRGKLEEIRTRFVLPTPEILPF